MLYFQIEIDTKPTPTATHAITIPTISPGDRFLFISLADASGVVSLPLMIELDALINVVSVELPLVVDLAALIDVVAIELPLVIQLVA